MFTVSTSPRKLSQLAVMFVLALGVSTAVAQTRYSTSISGLPGATLTWSYTTTNGTCGPSGTYHYQEIDYDNPYVIYEGKTTVLKIGVLASYITEYQWPVQACPNPGAYDGSFQFDGGTVTVIPNGGGTTASASWTKN